jgi:hypothetical protein
MEILGPPFRMCPARRWVQDATSEGSLSAGCTEIKKEGDAGVWDAIFRVAFNQVSPVPLWIVFRPPITNGWKCGSCGAAFLAAALEKLAVRPQGKPASAGNG